MILVADIGNTRLKWAGVTGHGLLDPGEVVHAQSPDAALESLARALPAGASRVVVTNVGGDALGSIFSEFSQERWGVAPQFVTPAPEAYGIRCGYADPSRLGADRWAALIAARRLTAGAVCVIDSGTAVTLDAVDAQGQHLGGLILAGPRMAAEALGRLTSGIGETRGEPGVCRGVGVLGASTDEAVAKGAMLSLAGALDRALSAVAAGLQTRPTVYITGGDAPRLSEWLETGTEYRRHLVLEGLAAITGWSDVRGRQPAQPSRLG